jgi:hypothetical protein
MLGNNASTFVDWLELSKLVKDETGLKNGLRDLQKDPNNPVYKRLKLHFTPTFLLLSANDEKLLGNYK